MHCYHSLFFSFPLHTYNTKVDFSIVIIQVELLSNGFCQQLFLYLRIAMAMKILYRNKKKVTCKAEKKIGRIIDPIFQNFSKLHSK